jgi:hypothetical protein
MEDFLSKIARLCGCEYRNPFEHLKKLEDSFLYDETKGKWTRVGVKDEDIENPAPLEPPPTMVPVNLELYSQNTVNLESRNRYVDLLKNDVKLFVPKEPETNKVEESTPLKSE